MSQESVYSEPVERVWSAFPKARGRGGNKKDFAAKWEKLQLTEMDVDRVLALLDERPPEDGITGAAWLGLVIANEQPRKARKKKGDQVQDSASEIETAPIGSESVSKHPGGRPRKEGQVRLTLSVNERTMKIIRLMSSLQGIPMSELVDQWAADAIRTMPDLEKYV